MSTQSITALQEPGGVSAKLQSNTAGTAVLEKASRRVAVVTGAGRGIGRAFVDELHNRGYFVIPVVRNPDDVETLREVDEEHIAPVCCDVAAADAEVVLREFLEEILADRKVDLLINNAGFGATGYGVEGLKFEELERVLDIHLYAPIRCVRACLPFLRKSPGAAVLNISSRFGSTEWVATGKVPNAQATYAYRIAKASMNMFTSCLSAEMQAENIRVLAIDPGKVKTRFGPTDADTEPAEAAKQMVDLFENGSSTGLFLHAAGEQLPW